MQRMCARRPSAKSLIGQELLLDRLMPGRVPTHFMTEWDHAASGPVDQVMGAFLMIRRSLFEQLGGFDDRFHVYYEDVDLCARVCDAGFIVRHLAEATVRHDGQGTTRQVKARRLFYIQRSRILYAAKHHGSAATLILAAATFAVQLPLRLGSALLRRSPREAGQVVHATMLLAGAMPGILVRLRRAPAAPEFENCARRARRSQKDFMLHGQKIAVVLPAYNAEATLRRTFDEIPTDIVDDIILVDDASRDETAAVARAPRPPHHPPRPQPRLRRQPEDLLPARRWRAAPTSSSCSTPTTSTRRAW